MGIEEPSKAFKQGIFMLKGKLQSSMLKGLCGRETEGWEMGESRHSGELHSGLNLPLIVGELGHVI